MSTLGVEDTENDFSQNQPDPESCLSSPIHSGPFGADSSAISERAEMQSRPPNSEKRPHATVNLTHGHFVIEQERLEEEYRILRTKILTVRERRSEVRKFTNAVTKRKSEWLIRHNEVERDLSDAVSKYKSATMRRQAATECLEISRKLSPMSDCFYIWHRGPFGTINGLRLGSESPSFSPTALNDDASIGSSRVTGFLNAPTKSDFDLSALILSGPTLSSDVVHAGGFDKSTHKNVKVPWSEVNAALGMAALLLSTLEKKPGSGFKFLTHDIVPMGHCSKIGVLQPDGRPSALYNLFYTDDSFQFFGKRNFNTALDGLFHCLKDATDAASRIDKTIVLPYNVDISSRGEITIGGVPTSLGVDGKKWTRAMKYFLTDLKWLIAFTTKNADR